MKITQEEALRLAEKAGLTWNETERTFEYADEVKEEIGPGGVTMFTYPTIEVADEPVKLWGYYKRPWYERLWEWAIGNEWRFLLTVIVGAAIGVLVVSWLVGR